MFRVLMSFSCLIALCAPGLDTTSSAPVKAPYIVLEGNDAKEAGTIKRNEKTNVDLGKIAFYEKKTVRFRFKNTGDAPGEITGLKPSCSCISGTADKTRLEPQEEAVVTVMLDASQVNGGVFKRVLSVTIPERPSVNLTLRGEVLPPFNGLPESHQTFVLADGVSWTNRFTLTEAETNLFLGKPFITADETKLRATATVETNTQGKTSYDVTLVVTPLASGSHKLSLSLPLEGRPNPSPIKLSYSGSVGVEELKVVPSKIMLAPVEQSLTRQLNIRTTELNPATNALTWTPQRDGVSVQVQPRPKSPYLTVTLTLSPEAVANLLNEKDAQMTFNYPNYRSVSVDFFARPEPSAELAKAATDN